MKQTQTSHLDQADFAQTKELPSSKSNIQNLAGRGQRKVNETGMCEVRFLDCFSDIWML